LFLVELGAQPGAVFPGSLATFAIHRPSPVAVIRVNAIWKANRPR
jgi:hypothetical protein